MHLEGRNQPYRYEAQSLSFLFFLSLFFVSSPGPCNSSQPSKFQPDSSHEPLRSEPREPRPMIHDVELGSSAHCDGEDKAGGQGGVGQSIEARGLSLR